MHLFKIIIFIPLLLSFKTSSQVTIEPGVNFNRDELGYSIKGKYKQNNYSFALEFISNKADGPLNGKYNTHEFHLYVLNKKWDIGSFTLSAETGLGYIRGHENFNCVNIAEAWFDTHRCDERKVNKYSIPVSLSLFQLSPKLLDKIGFNVTYTLSELDDNLGIKIYIPFEF